MKKILIVLLFIPLIINCNQRGPNNVDGAGVEHLVFLKLRPDLRPSEEKDFRTYIQDLKKVEGVMAMSVKERVDVGDERALDYDLLLTVWLKDEESLKAYDQDSLHNEIRQVLYAYLYQAPATFDIVD